MKKQSCAYLFEPLYLKGLAAFLACFEFGETRIMANNGRRDKTEQSLGAFDVGAYFSHSAPLSLAKTCQENRPEVCQVSARHGVGYYLKKVVFGIVSSASLGSLLGPLDVPKWLSFLSLKLVLFSFE